MPRRSTTSSAIWSKLDEEAARVMRSQLAYQAAARVLTNFDQMAEEVVLRLGM